MIIIIILHLDDNLVRAHQQCHSLSTILNQIGNIVMGYNQWSIIWVNPIISDYRLSNLSRFPGFSVRACWPANFTSYFTWTHCLLFFRNYPPKKPKFNDVCVLFNTLIFAPECWKCTLRGPYFKSFPRGHAPGWTPLVTHPTTH